LIPSKQKVFISCKQYVVISYVTVMKVIHCDQRLRACAKPSQTVQNLTKCPSAHANLKHNLKFWFQTDQ